MKNQLIFIFLFQTLILKKKAKYNTGYKVTGVFIICFYTGNCS